MPNSVKDYRPSDETVEYAVKIIAANEGFRSRPYKDTNGVWTWGYGFTFSKGGVAPKNTGETSEEEARGILKEKVRELASKVVRLCGCVPTSGQLIAMTSLAYNIGTAAFTTSALLRHFRAADVRAASQEFQRWDGGAKNYSRGLAKRRHREAALFLTSDAELDA